MNEKINIAARKFDLIIEELGKSYNWINAFGQVVSYDKYYSELQVPMERVLNDQSKMIDILKDFYLNSNLDDFIILFAIYCNNYIRYNFHIRIEDENFGIEKLWDVIKDEDLQKYLSFIQLGINNRNINFFKKAVEIYEEYSLPYLYLFLDAIELVFTNNDNSKKDEMIEFYNSMNQDLQKYVLGDSKYMKKGIYSSEEKNYLPYIKFEDNWLSNMYGILEKTYGATFENISISNYKNGTIIEKLYYLKIPTRIEISVEEKCKESFSAELKLEKIKKELEKAIESKNELIDRHAHNWKHIIYPEVVKEVAEALYSEGNIEYANKLFKAYNSENILKNDLNLLKLNHASSEEEMQEIFTDDILLSTAKKGINIMQILEDSLDIVMFRIIMEDIDNSHILGKEKINLGAFNNIENLRKSYTENFIQQDKRQSSIVKWFNNNIYNLNININEYWKDVKIKKNNVAYTQLIEIFINLIHNAINYGIKSNEGFLNLKFDVENIDGIDYYSVTFENPIDHEFYFYEGNNQGIKSIKNTLEKLNRINIKQNKNVKSIDIYKNEELYNIKLYFSEELIVKRRK